MAVLRQNICTSAVPLVYLWIYSRPEANTDYATFGCKTAVPRVDKGSSIQALLHHYTQVLGRLRHTCSGFDSPL